MRPNSEQKLIEFFPKDVSLVEAFGCLFENASDAIYILDMHGDFVAVNRKAEELTGFKREDFIGKSFREVIPLKSLPKAITGFLNVIRGKSIRLELELKTAVKKTVLVELTSTPFISNGKIVGALGIARDITESKKVEEALQNSEEMFRTLMEEAPIGICNTDLKGKINYVNKRFEEALGYSREEIVGKNGFELSIMSDETLKSFKKRMKERLIGKPSRILEGRFKRKDGEWIWAETESRVIKKFGVPVGFQLISRDITERKKAEEERKRFEERHSALHTYSRDLNMAESMEEIYRLTFEAMKKTLGFEIAFFMIVDGNMLRVVDHIGYPKSFSKALPLDGTKKGVSVKVAKTGKTIYVPDAEKNDDWVEFMPGIRSGIDVPIKIGHEVLGVIGVDSKKLDAFNEKDQKLLEILASHAATAISNLEKRGEIERRSKQLAWLMYSSTEMIRSTDLHQRLEKIAKAIKELGWQRVVLYVTDENLEIRTPEDMVTAGLTNEEKEFLWNKRQPGLVWQERFSPEYDRFKIGSFYYLPWSDPWVRKTFTEDVVPSKLSPNDMVDWDPQDLLCAPLRLADGRFIGILSVDDPIDGRRPTKESLAPLELFLHQAAVAIENAQLFQQLNKAKNQVKEYSDQLELKVEQRTQELKEAQSKLLKAERLAAIGELAAMVGHDLRNPLTGIDAATYYLKTKLGSKMDEKTWEMLELIERNIESSNNIITDLLEYSRETRLETREISPKLILRGALSLVKFPENIQVIDMTQSQPKIKVDVEKMQRVFVNIIKNAIDAMPQGGTLRITSKQSNSSLEFNFTDTGVGMTEEVLKELWTPLFTTKAKGMGLGLPICKRIVEAHEGKISVKSKVNEGTTFSVTVPIKLETKGGENAWLKPPESLLSTTTKA